MYFAPGQVPALLRFPGSVASEIDHAAEIPLFLFRVQAFHLSTTVSLPLQHKVQYSVHEGVNCLQCNVSYEFPSPARVMKAPPRPYRRRLLPKGELA